MDQTVVRFVVGILLSVGCLHVSFESKGEKGRREKPQEGASDVETHGMDGRGEFSGRKARISRSMVGVWWSLD